MSIFDSGEVTFFLASVYFAVFIAVHVLVIVIGRRLETTPPREGSARARAATQIACLQTAKAGWFAVLFTVAAITVVDATPKLPLLEVITVYGGLIGVLISVAQAVDWFRVSARTRAAHRELRRLTVHEGEVAELVTVQMPRSVLDRLLDGGCLSTADLATIDASESKGQH